MFAEEKIDKQIKLGGINVGKLKPNTKIVVQTLRNVYFLKTLDNGNVIIKGGKYFPQEVERVFHGSTWGGSMIKTDWIGYSMRMEIGNGDHEVIITSPVQAATVIGEDWIYELDWPIRGDVREISVLDEPK